MSFAAFLLRSTSINGKMFVFFLITILLQAKKKENIGFLIRIYDCFLFTNDKMVIVCAKIKPHNEKNRRKTTE